MQLEPNAGKSLVIEIKGSPSSHGSSGSVRRFARYPIKTKLITPEDKDISVIVEEYSKKYIQPNDIVFISEKAVSITQGRSYHISTVKAGWLAAILSRFVTKTPVGIGLGSPQTMQLAIEEVGVPRILVAATIGGLAKFVGIKGVFYMIAGHGARSIDGAVPYAIPPYNHYVSKGPRYATEVAMKVSEKIGAPVAVVDANDLGVNVLGISGGLDKKLIARIIKDNPLGQSDEQTPVGIIREITALKTGLRKAEMSDFRSLSQITKLLHIDVPNFVWSDEKYIKRQIKNGEYFIIEQNGVLVGAMSLRVRNRKMHIETLVVNKEFQSKGFGTQFINFAKKFSLEKGYDKLHAYSFFEYNMEKFYLKKGFTELSHLGYYENHPYYCFELKLGLNHDPENT